MILRRVAKSRADRNANSNGDTKKNLNKERLVPIVQDSFVLWDFLFLLLDSTNLPFRTEL